MRNTFSQFNGVWHAWCSGRDLSVLGGKVMVRRSFLVGKGLCEIDFKVCVKLIEIDELGKWTNTGSGYLFIL